MESMKVFLDHLYFSIVCVAVGVLVLYLMLIGINAESIIYNNLLALGIICCVLCCALAAFLTFRTIKGRIRQPIIYTRRGE
jgi:hypothetical protein